MSWLGFGCLVVLAVSDVLRWRRVLRMSDRLEGLSKAHDTGVRRRDDHEIRLAEHERELGDLAEGLKLLGEKP